MSQKLGSADRWRALDWLLLGIATVSAIYLIIKVRAPWVLMDVDCFWYAGWLWDHGQNPYGPIFDQLKPAMFVGRDTPAFFVYPPHIWWLLAPLGLVGNPTGRIIWGAINLALFAGGHMLWWRTAKHYGLPATRVILLLIITTCLFTGTGLALEDGQTSFLVWFGFALLTYGLAVESCWVPGLALAILLLKPHIGLVTGIVVVGIRRDVLLAIVSGAIVSIASLPALAIGGARSMLDLVHNVGGYRDLVYDRFEAMTGLANLTAQWFHAYPRTATLELAAILAGLVVSFAIGRRQPGDSRVQVAASMGAVALFIPLHTYDLQFVPPIALILMPVRGTRWWILITAGFLLFLHSENLDHVPWLGNYATILTLGMILLIVVPIIHFLRGEGQSERLSSVPGAG